MAENTRISWTDHTFNPWWGCEKVSAGCTNCYAAAFDKRVGGAVDERDGVKKLRWGPQLFRRRTSPSNWREPLRWSAAAAAARRRSLVFTASMADVFEVPRAGMPDLDLWLVELLDLISRTPSLTWLMLTKRPETIRQRLEAAVDVLPRARVENAALASWLAAWLGGEAPSNVWLGTSVENADAARTRIPALMEIPAAVRFLSMEPLLEHVQLTALDAVGVDWAIVGGESGHHARAFDPAWASSVVEWGSTHAVPIFVKQLGTRPVGLSLKHLHGGDIREWSTALQVRQWPHVIAAERAPSPAESPSARTESDG